MTVYKNITIKMKGGKTRMQRVKVLKSGKYKFVKNLGSKAKKSTRKSVKNTVTRRRNTVAKKKKRGSRKFTIPIAPIVGLAAGLAGPIKDLMDGEVEFAVNKLKYSYLGLDTDNNFKAEALMNGLVPLIVGGLVHKYVGGAPLNLNRMLAAANVPIIRI